MYKKKSNGRKSNGRRSSSEGKRKKRSSKPEHSKNIHNTYNMNSCQMNYNISNREAILQTFKDNIDASLPDRKTRAYKFTENYQNMHDPIRLRQDLKKAKVSTDQYNAMINKDCPLGFNKKQYTNFCEELYEAVKKGCISHVPEIKPLFRLVLSGTSTTFYSENPTKENHFFDKDGKYESDIDVAVQFTDDTYRNNFISKTKHLESYPSSLPWQHYGQKACVSILNLQAFHEKWGPNNYQTDIDKRRTRLQRSVGIIILKIADTPTHNRLCDFRFYFQK